MKPGTAKITKTAEFWRVTFMWHGSFLEGEQKFTTEKEAVEFCAERRLRIWWLDL